MPKTQQELNNAHIARMKSEGYKQIRYWIPARDEEKVKRYCERKRREYEREIK